jgi:hypothetical protein
LFGAGVGILFALFFDLMKETSGIGTSTLASPIDFLNLIALAAGLLVLLFLSSKAPGTRANLILFYLWAVVGVGFHGLGEGIVIGYDFSTGATLLSLFQGLSYLAHKLGEGFTLGVLLAGNDYGTTQGLIGGFLAGSLILPGILAALLGLPGTLSTVFFAVGAGATMYVLAKFAALTGKVRYGTVIALLLGFSYMYFAGVLHQFI